MQSVKNITFTAMAMAVPLVVSLATVPFYIHKIGAERYGALAIAWLMLGYFSQADFGIGRAVMQRISSLDKDRRTGAQSAPIIWSALVLSIATGLLTSIILYFAAGYFFTELFQVDAGLASELQSALILLAMSGPVANIFSVAVGALQGAERQRAVALLNLVNGVSLQLFPLAAAYLVNIDLHTLILAALSSRIVTVLPPCILLWSTFLRRHPVHVSRLQVANLMNFGAWIMVSAIVSPLMVITDRFIIGAVAGALAVAAYTVPAQIASRTMIVPYAIMQVLFPQLAGLGEEDGRRRAAQALVAMGTIFAPVIIGLICLADPLMHLWLGDNLDPRSIMIGQILLVGWWGNALAQVPYGLIQARGNSRFTGLMHIVELPIYGAMLYAFWIAMGLNGMALAFTMRIFLDCAILLYKARLVQLGILGRLIGPALLIAASLALAPQLQDWATAMASASTLCVALAVLTFVVMPNEARRWTRQLLGR